MQTINLDCAKEPYDFSLPAVGVAGVEGDSVLPSVDWVGLSLGSLWLLEDRPAPEGERLSVE